MQIKAKVFITVTIFITIKNLLKTIQSIMHFISPLCEVSLLRNLTLFKSNAISYVTVICKCSNPLSQIQHLIPKNQYPIPKT